MAEVYNDYANSVNIAHDWVRWPCVRVSSAEIASYIDGAPFGFWYETWVFSDCPKIKTTSKTFKSSYRCLKAHMNIVENLKDKLNEED